MIFQAECTPLDWKLLVQLDLICVIIHALIYSRIIYIVEHVMFSVTTVQNVLMVSVLHVCKKFKINYFQEMSRVTRPSHVMKHAPTAKLMRKIVVIVG